MRNNNFKSKTHCVFNLTYHIVFITKFRKHIFSPQILSYLISILPQIAEQYKLKITEINGEADHIHFLLEASPQDCLGSVIGTLKCRSSSELQKVYKFPFWGKLSKTIWSKSYFICTTGGAPIEIIKKYIQNQGL
jgi:putative transposase